MIALKTAIKRLRQQVSGLVFALQVAVVLRTQSNSKTSAIFPFMTYMTTLFLYLASLVGWS